MNASASRHFYLFKGDWYEKFIDLIDQVEKDQQQRFDIWEPQDKKRDHHLIVVYGTPLSEEYCLSDRIWKTDEKIFDSFYKCEVYKFNIHSSYYCTAET